MLYQHRWYGSETADGGALDYKLAHTKAFGILAGYPENRGSTALLLLRFQSGRPEISALSLGQSRGVIAASRISL